MKTLDKVLKSYFNTSDSERLNLKHIFYDSEKHNDMSGIFKMGKLVEILENTYSNLDVIIMYDDINNLVNKINKDIELERGVK